MSSKLIFDSASDLFKQLVVELNFKRSSLEKKLVEELDEVDDNILTSSKLELLVFDNTKDAEPSPIGEQLSIRKGEDIVADLLIESNENSRLNCACLQVTECL
tara:strand:- start:108 stop:416 length:309 start_codon:yes stop_codon:yes gene_type:complete